MFNGKQTLVLVAAQIQEGISPGVKITGTTQAVTGAGRRRCVLSDMWTRAIRVPVLRCSDRRQPSRPATWPAVYSDQWIEYE